MIQQFAIRPAGGGTGGATLSLKISAGTLSANRTDVTFSNSNGVSFGLNAAGVVTATVQTNYLTTAMASNRGSDFVQATAAFAGTNASGTINSTGISVSVAASAVASVNFSAGTTSSNLNSVVFSNSNNVSFGLNGSTITASIFTTYAGTGFTSTTTAGTAVVGTLNTSGLSLGVPAFLTTAMQSGAATISNVKISAGASSSNVSAVTFSNANGVSFGYDGTNITATVATNYQSSGAYLTTAALSQDSSKYAGTAFATTTSAGAVIAGTLNTSGLTLGVPAFLTTAMASNAATISNINVSAGTTSTNLSNVVFSNSNGVSFGLNGSTVTASYQGFQSYWNNFPLASATISIANPSFSQQIIHPFFLPYYISASYLRMPATGVLAVGDFGTTANTQFTAQLFSTFNAVVYSMGTGASSNSLQYVVSGSATFGVKHSWSAGNTGSNWSQSISVSYPTRGTTSLFTNNGATTSASFNIHTSMWTAFQSARYMDFIFANSLSPGPYWMCVGYSSASSTQGNSNATNNNLGLSLLVLPQTNNAIGDFGGSIPVSQMFLLGHGNFSTTVVGTTASLDLTNISRQASQDLFHIQFIRQA